MIVIGIPLTIINLLFLTFKKNKSIYYDLPVYFFLLYYLAVVAVASIFFNLKQQNLIDGFANILYFITLFVVFKNINIRSKGFQRVNYICLFLMFLSVALLVSEGVFILAIEGVGLTSDQASYQLIAVIFLFCSIIYLVHENKNYKRFVFIAFSIVFLFFNGARSEFLAFIFVIPVLEFIRSNNRKTVLLSALLGITALFIAIVYAKSYFAESNNRIIDLLINVNSTSSGAARKLIFMHGWDVLSSSPLWGGINKYESGRYIHNWLSVWLDLGVLGFLFFNFLFLLPFLYSFYYILIKNNKDSLLLVLACFSFMSFVLLIFAKAFFYLLVPASMGVFSNYLSNKND